MRTMAALTHSYAAIVATLLVLLARTPLVDGIKCRIGMGQRGKMYENGIEWFRDCPNTKYCIEVYSGDQVQWEKLFDYPFDAYYNEYYARTCGGDLGTPEDYHPYRNNPEARDPHAQLVKLNITSPGLITGQGGTEELFVKYICRYDLCYENSAPASVKNSAVLVAALVSGATLLMAMW
jgi:hypothetical protein